MTAQSCLVHATVSGSTNRYYQYQIYFIIIIDLVEDILSILFMKLLIFLSFLSFILSLQQFHQSSTQKLLQQRFNERVERANSNENISKPTANLTFSDIPLLSLFPLLTNCPCRSNPLLMIPNNVACKLTCTISSTTCSYGSCIAPTCCYFQDPFCPKTCSGGNIQKIEQFDVRVSYSCIQGYVKRDDETGCRLVCEQGFTYNEATDSCIEDFINDNPYPYQSTQQQNQKNNFAHESDL